MKIIQGILIGALIISCSGKKNLSREFKLENDVDSISYYTGIFTAWTVKDLDNEVNKEAFYAGINEALNNEKPGITKEDANYNIMWFFERMSKKQQQKNLVEGQAFLERNKSRKEITVTPSGLQYEVIRKGNGTKPDEKDSLLVNFTGSLFDGTVFINTLIDGPQTFSLKQEDEMKGWLEALKLMDIGSSYKFYIPTELGFGNNPPPLRGLKANMPLIFEIELLSVIDGKTRQ